MHKKITLLLFRLLFSHCSVIKSYPVCG